MKPSRLAGLWVVLAASAVAYAADRPLLTAENAASWTPSSKQVTLTPQGAAVTVAIAPGDEGYPGVRLAPKEPWDLAQHGHIAATVTNTGKQPVYVSLRVDNNGNWQDSPWNAESEYLKPGQTGTIDVIFGYAYGHQKNYALDPSKVSGLLVFTGKATQAESFRIDRIVAAGPAGETPPVKPEAVRTVPPHGRIVGPGVTVSARELKTTHAQAIADGSALRVMFEPNQPDAAVDVVPPIGRWDLSHSLEVEVKLTNAGRTPVTPRVQIESNGGPSDWVAASEPLAPGKNVALTVPFAAKEIWTGEKDTGTKLSSDAVSGVKIAANHLAAPGVLRIESITAMVPPAPAMPEWLGKRPPVPGEWTETFDEEFNGSSIDESKWNIYTANYWDKLSHFSKDNLLLGDGAVKLHMEKKRGHQNDDPKEKETDYAVGFLNTYGKWTQKYGYFEARMKLPTAPGLWPAFWMMPDRGTGSADDPQWKRSDTANGGMEFDILEYLTRWGPFRYNIAMHWDGYGKDHKSTGSDKIYVQPDKDGCITAGLLWTPGELVYYANGKEVLRWKNDRVASVPAYVMFDMVTGGWDNAPLDDATLPDDLTIDYVRCWQRKDLAEAK